MLLLLAPNRWVLFQDSEFRTLGSCQMLFILGPSGGPGASALWGPQNSWAWRLGSMYKYWADWRWRRSCCREHTRAHTHWRKQRTRSLVFLFVFCVCWERERERGMLWPLKAAFNRLSSGWTWCWRWKQLNNRTGARPARPYVWVRACVCVIYPAGMSWPIWRIRMSSVLFMQQNVLCWYCCFLLLL